jgi:hypothetical protein
MELPIALLRASLLHTRLSSLPPMTGRPRQFPQCDGHDATHVLPPGLPPLSVNCKTRLPKSIRPTSAPRTFPLSTSSSNPSIICAITTSVPRCSHLVSGFYWVCCVTDDAGLWCRGCLLNSHPCLSSCLRAIILSCLILSENITNVWPVKLEIPTPNKRCERRAISEDCLQVKVTLRTQKERLSGFLQRP